MVSDRLFVGIDSGTQGTKAVVLSEKTGEVLAQSHYGYSLLENERGGREQDPEQWLIACRAVLRDVLSHSAVNPSQVRAIGVSGQQHGMVPLDRAGKVIRPAKLWCDTETASQCRTLTERIGGEAAVRQRIGNQIAAGFTASKILWLSETEPENYSRLATVLLPHDYINFWLTVEKCCECGDASGTAYFDVVNRRWSDELLLAIDPSGRLRQCMPSMRESHEPAGILRRELAIEFGLAFDVLVASGGGDNMMAAIGTGNVVPGVVTASLGTSGTIYAYSGNPVVDSRDELAAFCSSSGGWLPLVCTMNVTVATELVRGLFGFDLGEMNRLAGEVAPGAGGLLLLPYFCGERTPALPMSRATLTGMTTLNMQPAMICRAAMEGATFGMRYGLEVLRRNEIEAREIRLVGGGAKSSLWQHLVADIFNCEVVCLLHEEAGAVGAALQALWCVESVSGRNTSLAEIVKRYVKLQDSGRVIPDSVNSQRYEDIYQRYLSLNHIVAPLYS